MADDFSQHFAAEVAARRKHLNLTLEALNAAGGPTPPVIAQAERGDLKSPRPSTLTKFDNGLQWLPGSAATTFWEGGDPQTTDVPPTRDFEPGAGTVPLDLESFLGLMTAQRELHDIAARSLSGELERANRLIDDFISQVAGAFVTDLLERNQDSDGGRTTHPLIEYAFGELLSTSVSSDDPDASEKLYRRWLIGREPNLDRGQLADFESRLRRKRQGPRAGRG
ncbi:hypothetical protein OG921_04900 [Aldersonia sp. NBC_00410]|uniref:hypothetical protein n=1 Tax=Aldersonia sp. NBC_00410 TaxID=2975954 RepID=UPI002257052E|nr:hypothetical protein [Aldersonia sp. NBC_00410]MCX5042510.1 hypothetical protein [Aldersonia sp. NBC_00410]